MSEDVDMRRSYTEGYIISCSWCGRATDFGKAHLCRHCWPIRNTPGGPQVIEITEADIRAAIENGGDS